MRTAAENRLLEDKAREWFSEMRDAPPGRGKYSVILSAMQEAFDLARGLSEKK